MICIHYVCMWPRLGWVGSHIVGWGFEAICMTNIVSSHAVCLPGVCEGGGLEVCCRWSVIVSLYVCLSVRGRKATLRAFGQRSDSRLQGWKGRSGYKWPPTRRKHCKLCEYRLSVWISLIELGDILDKWPPTRRKHRKLCEYSFFSVDFIDRVGRHLWPVNPALARLNKELKHCKLEPAHG